jgi:hypothetical protein
VTVSMTRSRLAAAVPDAEQSLGRHLLDVVHRQDAVIPADRRAPRTVAEMRARLAAVALYEEEQDACGLCGNWICTCGTPKQAAGLAGSAVTA